MEICDFDFTLRHRQGTLMKVPDYLSRMEYNKEYTLKEVTGKEIREITCFAITRSKQIAADEEQKEKKIDQEVYIEERNNICTRKNVYDHIFFLFSEANCDMQKKLEKIMKRPVLIENDKGTSIDNNKTSRVHLKNIFSLSDIQKSEEIAKMILQKCKEKRFENIAINIDLKQRKSYVNFKNELKNIFKESPINITLHLDQIISVDEAEQVQEILNIYHSINHCGFERMINTIRRTYWWPTMDADIKEFVKKCGTCEKTKYGPKTRSPLQISSTGNHALSHIFHHPTVTITFSWPTAT